MSRSKNADLVGRAVRRVLFASALAATAGQATQVAAQEAAAGAEVQEEVVVTGSRLLRSRDLVEVSPVQTVNVEEISLSGNVTLEDTLNQFPQLNPDNTGTVNQSGGSGVLSADLRGLGAVRTLVLVDGRRFIPADVTGLVDPATIPDSLIERVEIITGGASAVYGSDAIAGAVNFILKDDFEGTEFKAQYGETDRGDGQNRKLDMLFGVNTEDGRGNVTLHASYTNRDPVFMADREFSRQPLIEDPQGNLVNFGSGNIPGGLISIPASQFGQINGVDLSNSDGSCPGATRACASATSSHRAVQLCGGELPAASLRALAGVHHRALRLQREGPGVRTILLHEEGKRVPAGARGSLAHGFRPAHGHRAVHQRRHQPAVPAAAA